MKEGNAKGSELIIFDDGTLYHIDLKEADGVPPNLFFVGSAARVDVIAGFFDEVIFEHRNESRPEFYIKWGTYKGIPMGAFSCGIGPDNIEIVLTELHALFEYDHRTDTWSDTPASVNIIRLGSCGTSIPEIRNGDFAISRYAVGLDNLGAYYPAPKNRSKTAAAIEQQFLKTAIGNVNPLSYVSKASKKAVDALEQAAGSMGEDDRIWTGITTASPGFYAPEGREIGRIHSALTFDEFRKSIQEFEYDGMQIVNHEMETSILFRIGVEQLGYTIGAICVVLDNLASDEVISAPEAALRTEACAKLALEAMVLLVN